MGLNLKNLYLMSSFAILNTMMNILKKFLIEDCVTVNCHYIKTLT